MFDVLTSSPMYLFETTAPLCIIAGQLEGCQRNKNERKRTGSGKINSWRFHLAILRTARGTFFTGFTCRAADPNLYIYPSITTRTREMQENLDGYRVQEVGESLMGIRKKAAGMIE
jgi:hypothetical protein